MNSRAFATIKQLQLEIKNKTVTPRELIEFYVKRFEAFDSKLGSAIHIFDKKSILETMVPNGPLSGIPGLIKNNICIKDRTITCASRMLEHFVSPYDATAIERLRAVGAPFIGTANLDEFAMGSSTETSAFKKTKNPWDLTRVPGGSSGGSAAAVAAGLVPWALGSETGGSVRQPAALCGIVGLKPTYGLISRYGLIAYASSLDQIGIMTRTVWDNALVLSHMAGVDPKDSSTRADGPQDYTKNLKNELPRPLKIGIVSDALNTQGMDPQVVTAIKKALEVFKQLGASIHEVELPAVEHSAAAYFILSRAEAASNLARFDGVRYGFRDKKATTLRAMYEDSRHDGFGYEVKKRIMIGNYVLSAGHSGEYYDSAQLVKRLIRKQFIDAFATVDLLIMPSQPAPAFKIGAYDADPLQIDLQDYFTCPMNLAGVPALSVPCGMSSNKLPIGLQIVGSHGQEELIYQAAHAYEQTTPWHTMHPEGY